MPIQDIILWPELPHARSLVGGEGEGSGSIVTTNMFFFGRGAGGQDSMVSFRDSSLTVAAHPHGEALLQAAVLTSVPGVLRHLALLAAAALVAQLLPDGPFEEPLAAFATDGAVVTTCNNG